MPLSFGGKCVYDRNIDGIETQRFAKEICLNKGPQWTAESSPALQKLQNDHLWYIRKMMDAKTYLAAGPLMHQKDPLGICVVAAKTLEEAKAIVEADPAVKAGRLVVEIHPWWVAREVWE